jgi:signal transduction histidine kinase
MFLDKSTDTSLTKESQSLFNKKGFELLLNVDSDKFKIEKLNFIIDKFYYFGEWEDYKLATDQLYAISSSINDSINTAKAFKYFGNYYNNKTLIDSAFYFYSQAEKKFASINDLPNLSLVRLKKGIIQLNNNDYLSAEISLKKAYNYFVETDNKLNLNTTLNALGTVSSELKEYDKAIFYFEKSLVLVDDTGNINKIKDIANCYNNLGLVYFELKQYKKSSFFFTKALNNKNLKNYDVLLFSSILDNLAYSNLKMNKFDNVESMLLESLEITKKLNRASHMILNYVHLSEYYFKSNDFLKAKEFSILSLDIAKSSKLPYYRIVALKHASIIDSENSSQYSQEYSHISDSLQVAERKSKDLFARIELETNEIEKEKEEAISQKWLYLLISALVLCIVILLFIVFYFYAKKKEIALIKEQQAISQELFDVIQKQQALSEQVKSKEKKRIALELHDNIMNKLASTRFNLFVLSSKSDKETIDKALVHIEGIKDIEDEIRTITHDLSADYFMKNQDYKALIEQFYDNQNNLTGIRYILEFDEELNLEQLTNLQKLNIYRILQEAANNTNKHSGATEAIISFIKEENNVLMMIQDNGTGFNNNKSSTGIGIKNIKQRIATLKGKINIHTEPKKGVKIFISIPL